jgi:hypothetical protein
MEAEEMTMNTSSPHVAKSRDLVADFKKGIKQDPSLVCFHFWEPVYYKLDENDFPFGIRESVGHAMTFKILTDDTLKVIH